MQVLKSIPDLVSYLKEKSNSCVGCFADTGFLYALAYDDDRLFNKANDVHEALIEYKFPIYANVISRMEMIDLIFRKQVTLGCIELFEETNQHSYEKEIYRTLKDIRDKNSSAKKKNESYKVDEGRLKKVRKYIENQYGIKDWSAFCQKYVGTMLTNEWISLEEDLGLNFVEVMEGGTSDLFNKPLAWKDMVQLMGDQGLRGPDAMIANLFDKSNFELLVTGDSDFEKLFTDPLNQNSNKAIFHLQ